MRRGTARIIRTEKPQLVLLDLLLPSVDGIELLQQVPGLFDLSVIFISAYSRDETAARSTRARPTTSSSWWRGSGRPSEGTPDSSRS